MSLKSNRSTLGLAISALSVQWPCALTVLSAVFCLSLAAQTHAPSAPVVGGASAGGQQVQASLDAIPIDLLVLDKKKRPVLDLASSDIAVSDAGNTIQLSGLHLVNAQSGGAVTVSLLFDHMAPESAKVARDIETKLAPMLPQSCALAVFGLDRGLRIFQNFTKDRAAIQSATSLAVGDAPGRELTVAEKELLSVAQTGSLPSGASASVEERAKARMILAALEDSQHAVQEQHASVALAGLQALAKAQQNLPGRKIVIFFSEGLSASSKSESLSQEVVQTANRAGIGIYTVDTNGVDSKSFDVLTLMYQTNMPTAPNETPGNMGVLPGLNASRIGLMAGIQPVSAAKSVSSLDDDRRRAEGNSLAFLATGTGGFAINAGEDLRKPLQRLMADLGTYYEAFYTPVLKDYDGQFHSIEIKPLREGVTVRSRAGYFALSPEAAGSFSVRPFEAPMLKILGDTQLPGDVVFQQTVLRLGGASGRTANELAVEVPVSHLELRQDQLTLLYSAHLSILAQIRDKSGVVIERFSQDVARNGALETIDAARAGVVTLQRPFTAAPGDYVLESAVLDRIGEKAGAQRTPFTIPAPGAGPWLSDIALVRNTEPLTGSSDVVEPMQYAKTRVVPNLAQQVPPGTKTISFFFRTRADASLTGTDGKLDLDVQQDGKTVSHSSMPVVHNTVSDSSLNMAIIQSGALAPGSYRAAFTYAQAQKTATRELLFSVDGMRLADEDSQPETAAGGTDAAPSTIAATAGLLEPAAGRFASSLPANNSRAPGANYVKSLLASARERGLGYVESLENFRCIEITDRFVDPKGAGSWPQHDKIAEMVTYESHEEMRNVLEINGQPAGSEPYNMKSARLEGAFGGVLKVVFDPASKADFAWKDTGILDGVPVEVFSYNVEEKNSKFSVTALPELPRMVSFHGLIYIDQATRGVRRATMEAAGIPSGSPVRASAVAIDYDYVSINNHDYLMPVRGELRMKLGKAEEIKHRIEFRDYHRFGSDARIIGVNQ